MLLKRCLPSFSPVLRWRRQKANKLLQTLGEVAADLYWLSTRPQLQEYLPLVREAVYRRLKAEAYRSHADRMQYEVSAHIMKIEPDGA